MALRLDRDRPYRPASVTSETSRVWQRRGGNARSYPTHRHNGRRTEEHSGIASAPVPGMTTDEVAQFLDEPGHLVRIATVDADGAPMVVPAWFIHRDAQLLVTPRERSAWRAHLQREPRVCFLIDEEQSPYRKVVVRGTVDVVHDLGHDDEWRDIYRAITLRYVPEAWADTYLQDTHDEPRALIALDMNKARLSTWRMPLAGEDPLAGWGPRYYHR